ncbi:MAG: MBL fold metallo-hydrolase [Christensenellales bacterium]|jgi:ribonuclease BN (tRNA processing enzyme)
MNIRVIGRYGRFPVNGGGTSCFLIESDKAAILLDMGCSSLSRFQKFTSLDKLSAIILTHLHADHIADFKAFTYMTSILKSECRLKRDIPVYMPKSPEWLYNDLIECKGIEFHILQDLMSANIEDLMLQFYKMVHPVETYGVRISGNGKTIAYTSDTLVNDNLTALLDGVDLAVGDACISDKDHNSSSPHLSVKQLAEAAKNAKVSRLMLAHLPDKGLDDILSEARHYMPPSVLAEEEVSYKV